MRCLGLWITSVCTRRLGLYERLGLNEAGGSAMYEHLVMNEAARLLAPQQAHFK